MPKTSRVRTKSRNRPGDAVLFESLTMQLPFEHLNLRQNPFGAVSLEEQARLAVVDVDDYVEYLGEPGRVLEFKGDHGRGKTTHLLAIRRHFQGATYLRASREEGEVEVVDEPVVFVDEAQFLSGRQRRAVFESGRSYVVSTHESLRRVYERAGLTWKTVELTGLDAGKLLEIAGRRIEAVRRGEGPVPEVCREVAEALIERHGDDLRTIEEHLYEVFQDLKEVRPVEIGDLLDEDDGRFGRR